MEAPSGHGVQEPGDELREAALPAANLKFPEGLHQRSKPRKVAKLGKRQVTRNRLAQYQVGASISQLLRSRRPLGRSCQAQRGDPPTQAGPPPRCAATPAEFRKRAAHGLPARL